MLAYYCFQRAFCTNLICTGAIKIHYPFTQQTLHFCSGFNYEKQNPSHKQMLITVGKYFHLSNKVAQKVCLEVCCVSKKSYYGGEKGGRK